MFLLLLLYLLFINCKIYSISIDIDICRDWMIEMENKMLHSHQELIVNCDFTWIVGHADRTTPVHDASTSGGFKVNLTILLLYS